MKRQITILYLIGIHLLLAVALFNSDVIDRVQAEPGSQHAERAPEFTRHFHRMLRYHKRMDGNVPDGSVLFIGDSITQGLAVSAVACPSVNYGIAGDTTAGVLERLPAYQSIERASVVVLAIGTNDLAVRSNEEIFQNYQSIVRQIPETTPIVISAILPVDEASRQEWQGRNQSRIASLNTRLKDLAADNDRIVYVDAGPLLVDASGNLSDPYHDGGGLHLNSKGNAIWINVLQEGIQKAQQTAAFERQ